MYMSMLSTPPKRELHSWLDEQGSRLYELCEQRISYDSHWPFYPFFKWIITDFVFLFAVPIENKKDSRSIEQMLADIKAKKKSTSSTSAGDLGASSSRNWRSVVCYLEER